MKKTILKGFIGLFLLTSVNIGNAATRTFTTVSPNPYYGYNPYYNPYNYNYNYNNGYNYYQNPYQYRTYNRYNNPTRINRARSFFSTMLSGGTLTGMTPQVNPYDPYDVGSYGYNQNYVDNYGNRFNSAQNFNSGVGVKILD